MSQASQPVGGRSPHNLPHRLTSFVGRSLELAELRRLLHERRLVTLTGAGGSGKTRLALETAAALAEDYPQGAFLVDLASLTTPELVAETVARALGIESTPAVSLDDSLPAFLAERKTLLVLDNCEHLLDECARLAATLLAASPGLCVLATSREPLGIGGECTFRVPLLSFPDPEALPSTEEMMQFEAVQLFLDRARLSDPAFSLDAGNAAAVAQVCARLDGIPLALELAAGALRVVSVSELAARLDQRFRLLTAGGRSVLPRHKTLGALLDWSHTLLDEREKCGPAAARGFPGGLDA